jgi:hypothetical protein
MGPCSRASLLIPTPWKNLSLGNKDLFLRVSGGVQKEKLEEMINKHLA